MKRSTERILTTHAGRLPNPHHIAEIQRARADGNQAIFDRLMYHTYWGSWHTPHTTDIPFKLIMDLLLKVNAQAYSVEAADVRHELDYQVWEEVKFPDGKIYIPGVIAHKTTSIEPPELVAHRIVRYANIMERETVIAGTDCGYGNRVYPDIAWAKMRAMADGAALATQQLWDCSSSGG